MTNKGIYLMHQGINKGMVAKKKEKDQRMVAYIVVDHLQ